MNHLYIIVSTGIVELAKLAKADSTQHSEVPTLIDALKKAL